MNIKTGLALVAVTIGLTPVQNLVAQPQVDPPTALIVSYRALPGARAKFRSIMQTEGVAEFEKWRQTEVFAGYRLLFTSYAADSAPDMFLVPRFNHFSDLIRWQRVEERYPGGLPDDAQLLATAYTSSIADIVKESSVAPTTRDSQFFVLEYDARVEMPKYTSYLLGYATPQFDAWGKMGVLSSYAIYTNQGPAGAPWSSFILLEYRDIKSLAAREAIENQARDDLAASDPTWKQWSEDKTPILTQKAAIPARPLGGF